MVTSASHRGKPYPRVTILPDATFPVGRVDLSAFLVFLVPEHVAGR
jgi:hypothetical protein